MAQKKAHEVDRWLARPDGNFRLILFYGPDRGLVAERAATFVRNLGIAADDPFAAVKLDGSDLSGDPGRIIDELQTIPMFGGTRLVQVRNGSGAGKELAGAVQVLDGQPSEHGYLVVEAGDLKKGSQPRAAFEAARSAMALPCYADDDRSVDRVLDAALTEAGMRITLDARQAFKDFLGGDRLATRAEIEKLILYCEGEAEIHREHVNASAGDVSLLSVDAIVDFVLTGKPQEFDRAFARSMTAGTAPHVLISAVMRQLQQLQELCFRLERDRMSAGDAVASARPPVFFGRRATVTRMLSALDSRTINRMLERTQEAVIATRTSSMMVESLAHRLLLSLCLEASRAYRTA